MPIVKYGGENGYQLSLDKSKDLIAIRTRSQKPIGSRSNVREPIESELSGCELVTQFPEAGVEVYRVPRNERKSATTSRKTALRSYPDIRFAGGVLIDTQSKEPILYTENIYLRFSDHLDANECETIIRESALIIKQKLEFATNSYFVQATEGTGQKVFDMALTLLERPDVEVCHPELVRQRHRKAFFPQQWHLASTVVDGMLINQHAHVDAAHTHSRGVGTIIAVIDDGVDIDHTEFSVPGKITAPLDAMSGSNDPRPRDRFAPEHFDNHGTACAGVACASGVNGAVGVAPDAKLMAIRLTANLGSMVEANAFKWAVDNGADVISCSWGPPDGRWFEPSDPRHDVFVPLPDSTRDVMNYAVTHGRNGLGCVILFAAGNGNESVENDGYASHAQVIAVAACNDRGARSVYSDFGESVWCSFPSSDSGFPRFSHPEPLTTGIWTTDRHGAIGYNSGADQSDGDISGNYTNSFGGTSSSCPGVAGVCALILNMNPQLDWLEVREILKRSCDKIDQSNGDYDANGHSPLYGYGRVNALRAVELAKPLLRDNIEIGRVVSTPIPDLGEASVSLHVQEDAQIADVFVEVDILHSYIGDLVISLETPAISSPVILQQRKGGSRDNLQQTYRSTSHEALAKLRDKSCLGQWVLKVKDEARRDIGSIEGFKLTISFSSSATRSSNQSKSKAQVVTKKKARRRSTGRSNKRVRVSKAVKK